MSEIAIKAQELGHRYGNQWAVRGLDLEVPKGSVYGFLGLNGAGKSTTIRMLMGLLPMNEGEASILGYKPDKDHLKLKEVVGYVPDRGNYYGWMKVEELVGFVAHYRRTRWNHQKAQQIAKRFDIPYHQKIKTLSKGQLAKVSLLLALGFDPEVLLLDEPTGGLDPVVRREFIEGLLAEYVDEGKTILISSHLINEIAGVVDRVGILVKGKLKYNIETEALLSSVRRIDLTFADAPPQMGFLTGQISSKSAGRGVSIVVENFNEERVRGELAPYNPDRMTFEALSLEDVFVEMNQVFRKEEEVLS